MSFQGEDGEGISGDIDGERLVEIELIRGDSGLTKSLWVSYSIAQGERLVSTYLGIERPLILGEAKKSRKEDYPNKEEKDNRSRNCR